MSEKVRQPQDKYILRMPDGMRDRLKDEAAKNNRSLNAEIIARLEGTFRPPAGSEALDTNDMANTTRALQEAIAEVKNSSRQYIMAMRFLIENAVADGGKLSDTDLAFAKRLISSASLLTHDPANVKDQPGIGIGQKPDDRLKDQPGLSRSKRSQD